MTQNTINRTISKPFYAITGALVGTLIPLASAGMDLLEGGASLEATIRNDLYRRYNRQE
jgi:hypothetical protein